MANFDTFDSIFDPANITAEEKEYWKKKYEQSVGEMFSYIPFKTEADFMGICAASMKAAEEKGIEVKPREDVYLKAYKVASEAVAFSNKSFCTFGLNAIVDKNEGLVFGVAIDTYTYTTMTDKEGLPELKKMVNACESVSYMYFSEESKAYTYNDQMKENGEFAPFVRLCLEVIPEI